MPQHIQDQKSLHIKAMSNVQAMSLPVLVSQSGVHARACFDCWYTQTTKSVDVDKHMTCSRLLKLNKLTVTHVLGKLLPRCADITGSK